MELINRYVAEVGRHLPEKMRPDIEQELRSILEDMLDDRARTAGKPADEEMVVALLKEYGEPAKVAATYHAPRYLVGPAVYPTFIMVMKIVLTVIAVVAVIQFGFSAARPGATPEQIGMAFLQGFSTLFNGGLTALGIVTLIFALNERFNPNLKFDKQEWNPRELRPVPQSASRIKVGDLVASVVFNLIAIVVFNLYFDRIGIYTNFNGDWTMIPIFSEVLRGYVLYFTLLWGLEIALHVYVLQAGRWDVRHALAGDWPLAGFGRHAHRGPERPEHRRPRAAAPGGLAGGRDGRPPGDQPAKRTRPRRALDHRHRADRGGCRDGPAGLGPDPGSRRLVKYGGSDGIPSDPPY